ncbi:hypothetical protein ACC754_37220, partial [Rhizobium johnstonii]|uniref:hypothetical protein n=1 Tax=Rhizobium johnstonii TaxID=3019933 RepID=UPI003F99F594
MAARKADHPLQRYEKRGAFGFATSRHLHHLPGRDRGRLALAFHPLSLRCLSVAVGFAVPG